MPLKGCIKSFKGQKFGRLTILEDGGAFDNVLCQCECGKQKRIRRKNVTSGNTKSCGCLRVEFSLNKLAKSRRIIHGLSNHPVFDALHNAIQRCHNPKHVHYYCYGAIGTCVCDEWRQPGGVGTQQFIDDMLPTWFEGAHLDKDKYSLPGQPKCYSPTTCCWVSPTENFFIRDHPELYPITRDAVMDPFVSWKLATS